MALNIPQVPRRLDIRKAPPKSPEDVPSYLKELVQAINRQNELISSAISGMEGADVFANRPPAAIKGRLYYSTDNGHLYVDDGTNWRLVI